MNERLDVAARERESVLVLGDGVVPRVDEEKIDPASVRLISSAIRQSHAPRGFLRRRYGRGERIAR